MMYKAYIALMYILLNETKAKCILNVFILGFWNAVYLPNLVDVYIDKVSLLGGAYGPGGCSNRHIKHVRSQLWIRGPFSVD